MADCFGFAEGNRLDNSASPPAFFIMKMLEKINNNEILTIAHEVITLSRSISGRNYANCQLLISDKITNEQ